MGSVRVAAAAAAGVLWREKKYLFRVHWRYDIFMSLCHAVVKQQ